MSEWLQWQRATTRLEIILFLTLASWFGFVLGAMFLWALGWRKVRDDSPPVRRLPWERVRELESSYPHIRRHEVLMRDEWADAVTVCLCPDLPLIGSAFDKTRILTHQVANLQHGSERLWIVTSYYEIPKEQS